MLRVELEAEEVHVPLQPIGQELQNLRDYAVGLEYEEIVGQELDIYLQRIQNDANLPQAVR